MRRFALIWGLFALLVGLNLEAKPSFSEAIEKQRQISTERLLKNIHPKGTLPGTVIASPSRSNPDYFFHWVRDAALVMSAIIDLYEGAKDPIRQNEYRKIINDYAELVRHHQNVPTLSGFGEPKFFVSGAGFDGPWGRPQNDGPALRAISLMRWAVIQGGELSMYDAIKPDLEYVSHRWRDKNFDLWEEVHGHHFYTRLVQHRALKEGALFAAKLSDPKASEWYAKQAKLIKRSLRPFFDRSRKVILTHLTDKAHQRREKHSNLDTANVLAILHGDDPNDPEFIDHPYLLNTIVELDKSFHREYQLNQKTSGANAFGRYPEDVYMNGNPWFLTTFAVAEHAFRLADHIEDKSEVILDRLTCGFYGKWIKLESCTSGNEPVTLGPGDQEFHSILKGLQKRGSSLLARGLRHMHQDTGQMDEQFDRNSGYMLSAYDLTWSYASFLTATK